jgi:hypothetical protein
MMSTDWQRKRSDFNHGWLKNRLLVALLKFMRVASGQVEDRDAEDALARLIAEWRGMRGTVCSLLDFIEQRTTKPMQPCLQDVRIFGDDAAEYLLEVERQTWLCRSGATHTTIKARSEVETLDRTMDALSQALSARVCSLQHLLENCLHAGRRLAERFSQLSVPRDFILG